jgi:hypothetical protein
MGGAAWVMRDIERRLLMDIPPAWYENSDFASICKIMNISLQPAWGGFSGKGTAGNEVGTDNL